MQEEATKIVDIDHLPEQLKPGLTGKNFRKIAPNGFGDPHNCYPHGMTWFKDCLFVGTTRANLANRAKQIQSNTPDRMGEIWPVIVPESHFDNNLQAEIWRYHPPSDEWKRVFVSPIVKGVDGFDVPISVGFRCMTPFQGTNDSEPALYTPTWGSHQTPGTLMLRSADGDSFEVVSELGLGITDNKPRSLRGIVPFKNRLFTSPVVGQKRLEPNIAGSAIVYASTTPNHGKWQVVCEPCFGNPNNVSVFHMAEFNGHLYAGTLNIHEGFEIWKTDAEGNPPFKWKKVISAGAYRGKLNQMAMTLTPFKNHLYVGSAIQNCSWDFDYNVGPVPPEVIRIAPDDSWDLISGEPRLTPDGLKVPLSGLGPGFGNPFSGYIWAICEHDGWLYISTAVWTVFLRYAGRSDRWSKHLRSIFSPDKLEKIIHNFGGCDLWRTRDGHRWLPVTSNGFGNFFNIGFRNMVSSPYGLFVGAANPFSPEVAVRRVAKWNYEKNPNGGLEIWFGSHDYKGSPKSKVPGDMDEMHTIRSRLLDEEDSELCEDMLEEVIDEFYGGSGFRHFGFWKIGISDARIACENLMDEILAFIPEKKGAIVDLGCGLGETTKYLLKHFPQESITGVTHDSDALQECSKRSPHITFHCSNLPKLDLHQESFDIAIWVKGLEELGSRRKLLQGTYRLLKPGGRLVCFDILHDSSDGGGILQKMRLSGNSVETVEEYRDLLQSAGFEKIQLFDVTRECLGSFQRHVAKYFGLRKLSGKIGEKTAKKAEQYLLLDGVTSNKSVLISCVKPGERPRTMISKNVPPQAA